MPALSEAKQFVGLHARHMGLPSGLVSGVLRRVASLDDDGPGGWAHEWSNEAEAAMRRKDARAAANLYNLARFPCADTPVKMLAARLAAETFGGWLAAGGAGERREARLGEARVPFLFRPASRVDAPLVVLMGGIVSLKEQWGSFLGLGPRLGCAVAIADFPGIGENPVRYARDAAAVFGAIMDAAEGACDASRTLIVAPSFAGHLAILRARCDARVRAIVTVGAPLAHFFTAPDSPRGMPEITRAALMSAVGADASEFEPRLSELALHRQEIAELAVPVTYVASLRDEIIPQAEWREAAALTRNLCVYPFDDVHGAPGHLRETRLLILAALLRHSNRARSAIWIERALRWTRRVEPYRSQTA
jgi:esterase FrsA